MEQYVDDPQTFKPSRWLKEGADQKLHPFASLPYGYGARMCLGRRFADLEMQVLLAKVRITSTRRSSYNLSCKILVQFSYTSHLQLIREYKIEYNYEPLKYKVTFMYAPDGELKFNMINRNRAQQQQQQQKNVN